jgi:LuxR family maltose regulon positive regulatory protein
MAWVNVDRGALDEAQSLLDEAPVGPWASEPWLRVVHEVVRARLLIASGRPDEATRRLVVPSRGLAARAAGAWLDELVTSVAAEAFLASGEPQQALAVVTVGLPPGSPDRAVLTARACREIGDARGAGAAMASVIHDLHVAPRATQLQGWVIEAQLAHDRGQVARAVVLVERALRCAGDEENRRPLVPQAAWLRWFLDREGSALRELRPFVMSMLVRDDATPRSRSSVAVTGDVVLEQLTERETQVLELLAQMCSTDEIAAELFVSANTVKTHLKGIFRKYSVNRRVDAVRRGRELGLC